jgi:hypothetical protein
LGRDYVDGRDNTRIKFGDRHDGKSWRLGLRKGEFYAEPARQETVVLSRRREELRLR